MTPHVALLPFTSLIAEHRELGLVVAVLLGFGFGFVLERAGFGHATKLAAQFYFRDLAVLKVMFSAIVTAMLGVMIAAGLGVVQLQGLSQTIASETFIGPMLVGGLVLGVGFLISGYCPGTSVVGMVSGNLDAVFTFSGVIVGSVGYAELAAAVPAVDAFHVSGAKGQWFLQDLLDMPAPIVAALVTLLAIVIFIGADKLEALMARKGGFGTHPPLPTRPRSLAFSGLASVSLLALATLALPVRPQAKQTKSVSEISQPDFARRLLDEPWTLRILDLRASELCQDRRIPGAECTPEANLDQLGLPYTAGVRDLVLVAKGKLAQVPQPALGYPGRVLVLHDGFEGWTRYAITAPEAPDESAPAAEREAYRFRQAFHAAIMGAKPPAPPAAGTKRYVPKARKKKVGGCS